MWGWDGMHGGGGFTMILIWVLLVLGIVYLWRILDLGRSIGGGSRRPDPGDDEARAIVRRRYANGEIDKETFDRLMHDLG